MNKSMFISIIVGLMLIVDHSSAMLKLELSKASSSSVAVKLNVKTSSQDIKNIINIVEKDLKSSGYIHTVQAAPEVTVDLSFDSIMNKLQAVIYEADNKGRHEKLTFSFDKHKIRAIAHKISDAIYLQAIGHEGVFSTQMAYVLRQKTKGQLLYNLQVSDMDGHNVSSLMISKEPLMSPTWSPNGLSLAYVSFEGKRASIWKQEIATGQRELIARFPGINGAPSFSPDGKKMALVLTTTGAPKIHLLDLISKKMTVLTKGWSIDTEPTFSPDGQKIYFTSNRGGSPQIYSIDLDSKKVLRESFNGRYNAGVTVSPNGKTLVMLHKHSKHYALAKLQNNQMTELVKTDFDESPSFAPNGQMIVYATEVDGRKVLALVSIDGEVEINLPSTDGDVKDPAWSPFI